MHVHIYICMYVFKYLSPDITSYIEQNFDNFVAYVHVSVDFEHNEWYKQTYIQIRYAYISMIRQILRMSRSTKINFLSCGYVIFVKHGNVCM